MKPIRRSKLRIALGKTYYTFKTYLHWYLGKEKFARRFERDLLPCLWFEHRTPLLRKLKDVDMWLQQNKITNLKIAVKCLDGVIINQGRLFPTGV